MCLDTEAHRFKLILSDAFSGPSGSLRAASVNTALLRAMIRLAPNGMTVELLDTLGNLPLFNPDIESHAPRSCTATYSTGGG